jgi:hypothetical protein
MMDVFSRNLKLPVKPLNQIRKFHNPADVVVATSAILRYVETNPYFFHYRFGNNEGDAMVRGIGELKNAAQWLMEYKPGWTMRIKPIRRYTLRETQQEVIEEEPGTMQEM